MKIKPGEVLVGGLLVWLLWPKRKDDTPVIPATTIAPGEESGGTTLLGGSASSVQPIEVVNPAIIAVPDQCRLGLVNVDSEMNAYAQVSDIYSNPTFALYGGDGGSDNAMVTIADRICCGDKTAMIAGMMMGII